MRSESRRNVVSVAGGKIAYLWWCQVSDDLNVNADQFDVPRALALGIADAEELPELVDAVFAAIPSATFINLNAKKWYFNIRWNSLRNVTDPIDRLIVTALGGGDEDWRSINVLYRQVMRSSGANANSRYVTRDEYDKYLDWGVE